MRKIDLVLMQLSTMHDEIHEIKGEIRGINHRIDGVHTRIDTLIDAIAGLRTDFDRHTHDGPGTPPL